MLAIGSIFISGCASEQKPHDETIHEHAEAVYKCPMECEGDKTYKEMGSCPECGMDLAELGPTD